MLLFIVKRVTIGVFLIFLVAFLVFCGVYAVGNPVDILISPLATQEEVQQTIKAMGLDLPLHRQFFRFLGNTLQGNLGNSFIHSEPAVDIILRRLPATLEIAFFAMLLAILMGIPLGLFAGLNPNSTRSRGIMAGSILCFSLPNFWIGLLVIMVFAVNLGILPTGGRGETVDLFGIPFSFLTLNGLKHMLMPAFTLSLFQIALIIRLTRSGTRETLNMDYILYARARGLSRQRVVFVHLLKNILIPVVTVVGLGLADLIAFATVTEKVFSWPGVGRLFLDSVVNMDRPVIIAYVMMIVMIFIGVNMLVDIVYSILDPRIRLGGRKH